MDFEIKNPVHILVLVFLFLSIVVIVFLPVLSFVGFFGTADTESIERLNEMSEAVRLLVEMIVLFIQLVLVVFLMVIVPLLWYVLVNKYDLKKIFYSLKLKKQGIQKALLYGFLAAITMFLIIYFFELVLIEYGVETEDLGNAQDLASIFSPVVLFFIVAFQPIPEEIFFRGFLLGKIDSLWGKEVAIVLTAVLFGIAHLSYQKYFPALLIAVIGLILGYVVVKTRNLYSAITAHIIFNITAFILLFFGG